MGRTWTVLFSAVFSSMHDEWGKNFLVKKPLLKTGFFYIGKYTVNLSLP